MAGAEAEFQALAAEFAGILARKGYGHADVVPDEAMPLRFYSVRRWNDITAAQRCHGDPDVQALTLRLHKIARVAQMVNGVKRAEPTNFVVEERRARVEPERRTGFDR